MSEEQTPYEAVEKTLRYSKVENNAQIGRMFYQAQNDTAGYPNGMAYWPEMSSVDKYRETMTALDLIRMMAGAGMITINVPLGFPDNAVWGEGECKELFDHFEANREGELNEFNQKLAEMQETMKKLNAG